MKGIEDGLVLASAAGLLLAASTAQAEEPQEITKRPPGIYVEVDPSRITDHPPVQHGSDAHILYLNRCEGGLTIYPGNGGSIANESAIVGGVINFPPFPFGDTAWNQVVDHTRDIYSPFNVLVTDVDPGNTPHDEALVCGSGAAAGFGGAGGVAPFSCGVIPNAITFTFPESIGNNPRVLAEVVGQESAHAWGLDHELLCEDPMTYLSGCGQKNFQDVDAQCGEFNPRQCYCGGSTQNSYEHIMNTWGSAVPDTQAPTAAITYPSDGEVFAPGSSFDITVSVNDDVQVDTVYLYVDGAQQGSDESDPYGPWPVTNIPEGVYEFYIEATDVAGNTTMSPVVTISVSADGTPPPDPDPTAGDGGDGGDDGGDGGGSGGSADGGGDAGDGGDGGGSGDGGIGADGGALPPNYGNGFGSGAGGCACSTDAPAGGLGFGLMLLGLLGLRTSGHRRR